MQDGWCAATIHVDIAPSRRLAAFHVITHGGAVAALWASALAVPLAWLASLALAAHGAWQLHREWRRADPWRVRRLVSLPAGEWRLVTASGADLEARLLPGTLVHPAFTILAFRVPGRRLPLGVVLTPDNAPAQPFRRLRVRLLLADQAGQ